jgi:hypothetical protein
MIMLLGSQPVRIALNLQTNQFVSGWNLRRRTKVSFRINQRLAGKSLRTKNAKDCTSKVKILVTSRSPLRPLGRTAVVTRTSLLRTILLVELTLMMHQVTELMTAERTRTFLMWPKMITGIVTQRIVKWALVQSYSRNLFKFLTRQWWLTS